MSGMTISIHPRVNFKHPFSHNIRSYKMCLSQLMAEEKVESREDPEFRRISIVQVKVD